MSESQAKLKMIGKATRAVLLGAAAMYAISNPTPKEADACMGCTFLPSGIANCTNNLTQGAFGCVVTTHEQACSLFNFSCNI